MSLNTSPNPPVLWSDIPAQFSFTFDLTLFCDKRSHSSHKSIAKLGFVSLELPVPPSPGIILGEME